MWPRTGFKLKSGIIDAWRNEYSRRFFKRGEINSKTKIKRGKKKKRLLIFDRGQFAPISRVLTRVWRSIDEHQA